MKIGVVTEASTVDKNKDVIEALNGFGHKILNAGMKKADDQPALSYLETSLISAILLKLNVVDFVVGGCGTGQGYFNAIMQFPGISCGLILDPVDAWLFAQVNGGNSISLSLNKGYGLGGNINLKFIFEKLFSVEFGCGYPEHRKIPQKEAREALAKLSEKAHFPFDVIIDEMDYTVMKKVLTFPGIWQIIDGAPDNDSKLKRTLYKRYKNL
jgi:ribose 5-phosphate isomerase RpiB